jgi:hypothetical protein
MRQGLNVADSSYLQMNEAYKHHLSLSSRLLSMPCWEGKPIGRRIFANVFIQNLFQHGACCLDADKGFLFLIYDFSSLGFNFDMSVDFGFNFRFPYIFVVLYLY